jgi:class 3 adenylate cyclase/predicted ATPase
VEIAAWLHGLGLEQYEAAFRDNAIDADVLRDLTEVDLEKLGVTSLGHRKKLLRAIAASTALNPESKPAVPPSSGERSTHVAERRQLTVMFADLVGSTALSRHLDPEEMREVLRGYQNAVAGEVVRFEGHVAKFMGDGVLAYFGWPRAHEDEAERAVRAGLAIVGAVAALPKTQGKPLAARVGIATGLVVVGDLIGSGSTQEEAVVGHTPNLAARLQAAASPGDIVLAESTRRLLGATFELEDQGPFVLAGFTEPVCAFRVVGEGRVEGRFEALHAGRPVPLIGREQELGLLLDRWRLAEAGEGQVVLLSGEPGIGKSRIVLALRERLRTEPCTIIRFNSSPYHTHSALWPMVAQLERAAGLEPADSREVKLSKLKALLGQAVDDADAVVPIFADLLGIPQDNGGPRLRLTPEEKKAQTFRALLGQLEGLARQRPILVILEDAHWLDPTTLELFELMVSRIERLPVLLIVTTRPEFRPAWIGRSHVMQLALSRLGRNQAAEVVRQVVSGRTLPAEIMDQILAKTDGVPLFVEELTKAVLELGLLRLERDEYLLQGPLPPLAIPDTLYGSLLARLDRLAAVKAVAQVGAVIGREFDYELLAAVASMDETDLKSALRQLIDAELVFPRGVPPEASYAFKHALVQEVAYGSLLKGRRQQLHARIAEELGKRFPDEMARQPEVLAHHLTEAGLVARALEFWGQAGKLALARSANREAVVHLAKAIQLVATLPANDVLKRREIELQGSLSVALTLARGLAAPEVEQAQLRARELAAELVDEEGWFRAQWGLWRVYNGRAQFGQALAVGRELLTVAVRGGNDAHVLQSHHCLWSSMLFRGDFLDARSHALKGLSLYDPQRHAGHALVYGGHDPGECALNQGGNVLWFLGYPDQAQRWHDDAMKLGERIGLPQVFAHILNWTAVRAQLAGDLAQLQTHVSQLTRLAVEHGFANWLPEAQILSGWIVAHQDMDRTVLGPMQRHIERRTASGTLFAQTWLWLVLAEACLAVGANKDAIGAVRAGLAAVHMTDERFCEAELHRTHAMTLLACDRGKADEAERALMDALAAARTREARMSELRAANAMASLWAERGERRRAYDLLAPLRAWFTEGLETRDLREAQALLDALS